MLVHWTSAGSGCGPAWAGKLILAITFTLGSSALAFQASGPGALGEDFVQRSENVFWGRLISSEAFVPESGGTILTRHTFEVFGWIKGAGKKRFEVLEYGGRVGDLSLSVSHQARYRLGGDYLVFSHQDPLGYRRTLGGPWGALPVLLDSAGEAMVRLGAEHPLRRPLDLKPGAFFVSLENLARQLDQIKEAQSNDIN